MWSNFVGILLFHTGNMIDTFVMTKSSCDLGHCCSPRNYPTITMCVHGTLRGFLGSVAPQDSCFFGLLGCEFVCGFTFLITSDDVQRP